MSKQLEFTSKEEIIIQESINNIVSILFSKMDEGVKNPNLEGTVEVDNQDKKAVFEFIAQKKT